MIRVGPRQWPRLFSRELRAPYAAHRVAKLDWNRHRKASAVQELTPRIITILRKYMSNSTARVGSRTRLSELEIDRLDLPMIFLDVEEVFDVQFDFQDEIEDLATIRCIVSCMASGLEAKALQQHSLRSLPRIRGNWMSTGAASRPAST
jgi:acyl carrier protein